VPRLSGAVLWLATVALLGIAASDAAPPENADPALHGWFESLKQPGSGVSCCSIADCRPVEYRLVADGYEAYLDTKWVHVPDDKVLHGTVNLVARGIVCRSPISGTILCFVPASET
jgi:hypothetical protein